jgi:hypothetical protein
MKLLEENIGEIIEDIKIDIDMEIKSPKYRQLEKKQINVITLN